METRIVCENGCTRVIMVVRFENCDLAGIQDTLSLNWSDCETNPHWDFNKKDHTKSILDTPVGQKYLRFRVRNVQVLSDFLWIWYMLGCSVKCLFISLRMALSDGRLKVIAHLCNKTHSNCLFMLRMDWNVLVYCNCYVLALD